MHSPTSKLRHFKLVHRRHSGRTVAHRHTSYAGLACILAIVGLVIYTSKGVWADPGPSQSVTVTATVASAPPVEGATITKPTDGTILTDQPTVEVNGTCAPGTSVIISSNNSVVGSTACQSDGTFSLNVQLDSGQNVLSARNYDGLNRPGPVTSNVTVMVKAATVASPTESPTDTTPVIPENTTPYVVEQNSDQTMCDTAKQPTSIPTSSKPRVAVTCIPWFFKPNVRYSIQYGAWGGAPPYAVDIDWGTASIPHTLVSLASATFKTASVTYAKAGVYNIKINVKDSSGAAAFVQAAANVPGDTSPITAVTNAITQTPWFSTPVPAYLLAVMITVGFWGGELLAHLAGGQGSAARHFRPKGPRKKPV